jgi:hypothetical protein
MDKPTDTSAAKAGLRKWIVPVAWVIGLGIVGAGVAWQVYRILPGWIEDSANDILLEKGIVLTDLPVEGIGWNQSHVGPGGLVYEAHSMTWEGIWIDYHFKDLLEGRLGTVIVEGPVFTIELPELAVIEDEQPDGADYLKPELVQLDLGEEGSGADEDTVRQQVSAPEVNGLPAMEEMPAETGIAETASIWEALQGLKLGTVHVQEGVVNLSLREERLMSFALKGDVVKEPFGVSGEFFLNNELLSSQFSLRAPIIVPTVTVQGSATLPEGGLKACFDRLLPLAGSLASPPELVTSGNLVMDVLIDLDDMNQLRGSAEIELDELVVRDSDSGLEFSVNKLLAAGYYKDGLLKIESGAEVFLPSGEDYGVDSFGMHLSMDSTGGYEFETETFGWNYSTMKGEAAVRGSGSLSGDHGRVEVALSEVIGDWVVFEPFSVLLEARPEGWLARTSEIGARKMDTIWIEDYILQVDRTLDSGKAGFTWYDAVGLHMGDIACEFTRDADDYRLSLSLNNPGQSPFLAGEYSVIGETTRIRADGNLPLPWLNSLGSWWGGVPAKFGGTNPTIQIELSGLHPFYSGKGKIELADSWIELDGETRLEGINGLVNLSIVGLPVVPEVQQLTIDSISSGQFQLEDIELEWAMPSIRRLEVKGLKARIGDGAISLDPFTVDPLKPVLQSRIHIDHLEGNQLLEWLGESRFSVEGNVSGRLVIGWQDGDIILGDGILELDSSEHDGRFVFEDPSFLKEQFDSFGGIQDDIKERFLSALLEEGIEIHSMEISLGAAPEEGKILLRMAVSGETKNELLEVPIEGFIINNVISGEDLGHLMGLIGPLRIRTDASGRN